MASYSLIMAYIFNNNKKTVLRRSAAGIVNAPVTVIFLI